MDGRSMYGCFFFFNDTATTEIYTLSLHDALPISLVPNGRHRSTGVEPAGAAVPIGVPKQTLIDGFLASAGQRLPQQTYGDRKSTRLNSSHANISYAVFCLKKKNPISRLTPILCPH